MDAIEVYGALRTYVNASLVGVGALKGANCTIQSIETSGNSHVVTFAWKDDDDVTHTSTMTVTDGTNGTDGEDGTDGVGISSIEKTSTQGLVDTYTVTLTNAQTYTFTVTNGQDGTGGSVAEMTDVILTDLNDGQVLRYSTVSHKWINADFDYDDLSNKPSLGTAAAKDSTNAVTENSTDLIESGAVFSGLAAKANTADLGTAATKNSTNQVTEDSTDLVESGAVQEAIASAISSVYKPCGNKAVAELTSDLLIAANLGNMYTTTDSGVTTADFIGGAGNTINAGDNVAVVEYSEGVYKFNLLSGAIDLSNYYTKTQTDSEIEEAVQALDVTDTAVAGSYVTGVSETDGKISVTREAADTNPTTSSKKMVTSGGVKTYVDGAIADLDVSDSAVAGSYVTTVSETDGKIAVTKEAADNTPTSSSTKMVKSGGVYTDIQNAYAANGELGAKNILIYPYTHTTKTVNDLTFLDNGDGTISINGTASAESTFYLYAVDGIAPLKAGTYILSGCPEGGNFESGYYLQISGRESSSSAWQTVALDIGEGAEFTITEEMVLWQRMDIFIRIRNGKAITNKTFYPMIRYASDTDNTYQSYAKTNSQLTQDLDAINTCSNTSSNTVLSETVSGSALIKKIYGMTVQDGTPTPSVPVDMVDSTVNFILSGKNLINRNYTETSPNRNGITAVKNIDGSVTFSGTCSANYQYVFQSVTKERLYLKKGSYKLSGCPSGGLCSLILVKGNQSYVDTGSGANVEIDTEGIWGIYLSIASGTVLNSPITVYPMLTLANVSDQTYEIGQSETIRTDLSLRAIEVASESGYNLKIDNKYYIADTLDWNEADGYVITRRIHDIVLDGTEAGWSMASDDHRFGIRYDTSMNEPLGTLGNYALMSHFAYSNMNNNPWGYSYISSAGWIVICNNNQVMASLEDFKTWLASNLPKIYYILANPYTEKITDEQANQLLNARTFDSVTSITAPSAIEPVITVEYAKNHISALGLTGHNGEAKADIKVDWQSNSILGAKNLLPYPYRDTTKEYYGLTFTDNGDGSVTVSGTATQEATFTLYQSLVNIPIMEGLSYTISGCPEGGTASTYRIQWANSSWTTQWLDYGDGDTFTITDSTTQYLNYIRIDIQSGTVCDNLVFKPMIRLASDKDDSFQLYSKTNKELTQLAYDNAGAHNATYRGKYLGSSVTDKQYYAIISGKFTDMYIGDYWTINGTTYRIAAFNYWLNTGDTQCTANHVVLVPDSNFYTAAMNSSETTSGGYVGSEMYTTNLADAITTITTDFTSDHLLNHRELLTNTVTDGASSAWAWYDSKVELMNEVMVYGHNTWGSHSGYETGIDKTQLPLFALKPEYITNRSPWWERNVASATYFAAVGNRGSADRGSSSYEYGVRPCFGIIG